MRIELTCSKGTYVRSLAHDIGRKLGCGGYLAELRRTSIGRFSVDQALTLAELEKCARSGRLETAVLPVEQVLNHSALKVTEAFSRKVINGRPLRTSDLLGV